MTQPIAKAAAAGYGGCAVSFALSRLARRRERTVRQRKPRRATVPVARSAWAELKHGWGGAYDFQRHGPVVRAVRRDGLGQITANSPEQLAPLVAADYAERPVPRPTAA